MTPIKKVNANIKLDSTQKISGFISFESSTKSIHIMIKPILFKIKNN